ncbi:MAG: hypothetical protein QW469_01465 [Candidatus Aenigmatarchaeota archaeon]
MPEYICFVKKNNVKKAEEKLRKDFDIAAKQSITIRDNISLGIKIQEEGSFFYIRGTEEGILRCRELIKEFVFELKNEILNEAKNKILEEEEKATTGFGGIFG